MFNRKMFYSIHKCNYTQLKIYAFLPFELAHYSTLSDMKKYLLFQAKKKQPRKGVKGYHQFNRKKINIKK